MPDGKEIHDFHHPCKNKLQVKKLFRNIKHGNTRHTVTPHLSSISHPTLHQSHFLKKKIINSNTPESGTNIRPIQNRLSKNMIKAFL